MLEKQRWAQGTLYGETLSTSPSSSILHLLWVTKPHHREFHVTHVGSWAPVIIICRTLSLSTMILFVLLPTFHYYISSNNEGRTIFQKNSKNRQKKIMKTQFDRGLRASNAKE
jgi:hypothetical protein